MDYIKLGQILRSARESAGYTQADIAVSLGVTPQNISSWERGKSKIDIDTFEYLCQKYNVSFVDTLETIKNTPPAITAGDENLNELLKLWHGASAEGQQAAMVLLRGYQCQTPRKSEGTGA